MIFLWIYIVGGIIAFLIVAGLFIYDEVDWSKDFETVSGELAMALGIGILIAGIWPLIGIVAIPAGLAWLVWKPLNTRAKLAKEAAK